MQRFIVYEQSHFSNPLRSKQLSKGGAELRALASHQCGLGNMGGVCCWFFPLLQEVFLRVLRFSSLLKNQQNQIPIRPVIRQAKSNTDYVDVPPLNRYLLIHYYYFFLFSKFTESSRTSCLTRGARLAKSLGLIIPHGL